MDGEGGDLGPEELFARLAAYVGQLDSGRRLTISQFTEEGLVSWELRRDEAGTPRVRFWRPVPWPDLCDQGVLSDSELSHVAWPEDGSRVLLVHGAPGHPYADPAYERISNAHYKAPAFVFTGPLDELLRRLIAALPLTQFYELVALRRIQLGRLMLTGIQLFPPGARRGARQSFTVRCAPGGENGTVFAVVATESVDQVRLVSLESISLAPRTYNLTAVLHRPGVIRFEGLPTKLREEHRAWPEIVTTIPARLSLSRPAHLICLVEVSGAREAVKDRLEWTDRLIKSVAAGAEARLKVSLITYGPHQVGRMFPEEPVRELAWAQASATALAALDRLQQAADRLQQAADQSKEPEPAPVGYTRAAQLECALTYVAELLDEHGGKEGHPVLVTVGSRPAHPSGVDRVSEIIPCPYRNDWQTAWHRLAGHQEISFGLISDHGPEEEEIWEHLASGAYASVDVYDGQHFAEQLGLLSKVEYIPFPLIEPEGS